MSENITRCPKCHTSFRVGEAHLNSAKGAVRCGSCLHVFNAREHLLPARKPVATEIISPTNTRAEDSESIDQSIISEQNQAHHYADDNQHAGFTKEVNSDDGYAEKVHHDVHAHEEEDILISDDMEKQQESDDDISDAFLNAGDEYGNDSYGSEDDYESGLFERSSMDSYGDTDDSDEDESWALNLLEDDDDDETSQDETAQIGKQNASESISNADHQMPLHDEHESIRAIEDEPVSDHSEYRDLFEEEQESANLDHDDAQQNDEHARDTADYYDEEEPTNEDDSSYFNSFQIVEEQEESYHKPIFEVFEEKSEEERNTELANQYLESIEPEPVEFAFKTHSNFWQSKILWGTLSLVTAVCLVAQIAWIKFDSWSIQQPYRQYYAIACDLLDCKLPVLIDRSKVKTANLVVRSHPNAANALIVDAILQNTAKFEQTFPVLDLVFTDSKEKVVAARRLNPRDYLGGELSGKTHMPIRQPIHIAIEVEDPGEKAVGYKISIAD